MVARGAGGAGPVLLACRQWDPMGWRGGCLAPGLVRGAVRHYCLGRCSALFVCARRSRQVRGTEAVRVIFPPPPCFPHSSRPPQCVLRDVMSGGRLPSAACMRFHAVCAFRGLPPVALPVRTVCSLCVSVRLCSRWVRAPPFSV